MDEETAREPLDAGGDAACWLGRVCPDCGALGDRPAALLCWRCGREQGAA